MKRTTIVAPAELLSRLRGIAEQEHVSLAEVIRQGLEWRVAQANRPPRFIAAGRATEASHDAARRADDTEYAPASWR